MKVLISEVINDLYKHNNKNYEYLLETIINSFDPKCSNIAIKEVNGVLFNSPKTVIEISESMIDSIKNMMNLEEVKMETVELLLWIAIFFPEI